jgi:alpha-amylase
MRKGFDGSQVVTILNNDGISGASRTISLPSSNKTGFAAGDIVTDVISCKNSTVDSKGDLQVTISGGMPVIFYAAKNLVNSGFCINGTTIVPPVINLDPPKNVGNTVGSGLGMLPFVGLFSLLLMLW